MASVAGRRLNIKLVSGMTPRAITRNLFEIDHNSSDIERRNSLTQYHLD
jgi:hypothetical protein